MPPSDLWTRLRRARPIRVLIVYAGASWVVLQIVDVVQSTLLLPEWIAPVSFLLLLVGAVVTLATAIVQGDPTTDQKEDAGEVPKDWQIAPADAVQSLKAGRLPHLTWGRALLGGLMAFWFLFGLAGLYVVISDRGESFAPTEAMADEAGTGIAVMPFNVDGSDDLLLSPEGMVEIFSTNLDGVGGFRTIDSRTVLARWGESIDEEADPDLPTILSVADETNAQYAVVGSVVSLGSSVRLSADLYTVADGTEIGQAVAEGPMDDVLELSNQLSVSIMQALLQGAGTDLPPVQHTASLTTSSLPALRAYLESETYYRQADFASAVEALERAVQADPEFALAYYRLSDAYGWIENIASEQGQIYMRRARELADRLPPRYLSLLNGAVALLEGDLTVVPEMERAVQRYPDDPEMWFILGELYYHYSHDLLKTTDDLDRVLSRAVALDPTFAPYYRHLIELRVKQGDEEGTAELLERYQPMASGSDSNDYLVRGNTLAFGDSAAVAAVYASLDTLGARSLFQTAGQLGVVGLGTEAMLAISRALNREAPGRRTREFILYSLTFQGQVDAAIAMLDHAELTPESRAYNTFYLQATTGSIPADVMDRNVTPDACDPVHPEENCVWAVALFAADQGRWDDFEGILSRNQEAIELLLAEGDSTHARSHGQAEMALRGYRAYVEGRVDEAIDMMEQARYGVSLDSPGDLHLLLGTLYAQEGRIEQAIRYFESFWHLPGRWYASLRLGDLYAELGDTERSRYYYALFLEDWIDPDEGRPEVDRALAAIASGG